MSQSHSTNTRIAFHILATSDVHGVLRSKGSATEPKGGLARIATLVDEIRMQQPNCLLLDNGDFLQGTTLCDFMAEGALPMVQGHPVIRAMNHLKYDTVGLGNHEFDFGIPFLNNTIEQATFPVIGSNVGCEGQRWREKIILERVFVDDIGQKHLVKIGILSVMPEQVVAWNAGQLRNKLATKDITQTAKKTAKALRQAGAQIVIALVHSGIGCAAVQPKQENAAIPIARSAEIDAMICGHSHQLLPGPSCTPTEDVDYEAGRICGVPAAMPGFNGTYLSQITLWLRPRQGGFHIEADQSSLLPASTAPKASGPVENPAIAAIAQEADAACVDLLNEPVGNLKAPIHSYYSRLPGDRSVALIAQAQLDFAVRNLGKYLPEDRPLLSVASPFKGGGRGGAGNFASAPAGKVTRQDLTTLYPFQNTLTALRINGAELKDWLEMSASNFNRIQPGSQTGLLRDPSFPCYGFDTIFGVTYQINLSQPAKFDVLGKVVSAGQRIENLCWQGEEVTDAQEFTLLTTSYRAGGGGNFPNAQALTQIDTPAQDSRTLLANYIAQGIDPDALPKSPWHFSHMPGTVACTLIGPDVLPFFHDGDRPEIEITPGNFDENGFVTFSVDLGA